MDSRAVTLWCNQVITNTGKSVVDTVTLDLTVLATAVSIINSWHGVAHGYLSQHIFY